MARLTYTRDVPDVDLPRVTAILDKQVPARAGETFAQRFQRFVDGILRHQDYRARSDSRPPIVPDTTLFPD